MSFNPVIRAYCRQVGKELELPGQHKRRLLDGLERELEERFSSDTGLTLETLCKNAGPPEESAAALMECVDENERTRYQARKKLLTRIAIIVLGAMVVAMLIYFTYMTQYDIDHTEVRIIQNSAY